MKKVFDSCNDSVPYSNELNASGFFFKKNYLDAYLKLHPHETRLQHPAFTEVQAATRLLDKWHNKDYAKELIDLIFRRRYPSEYLALRFGWEKEHHWARYLETQAEISSDERPFEERQMLYDDRELLYAEWEKNI